MKVLENTPAVLSLGKLCDENGYSYEWINGQKPHLIKNGIRIQCNTGELRSDRGSGLVSEFSLFNINDTFKTRDCREQKRVELEERGTRIEENRQAAEAEAREKERIMKQTRRAEMENERLEEADNYTAKDDNDTTIEARADDSTTEEKGSKAKADDFTTGNRR